MDDKTEDLRDLFVDVAGTDTVTEGQDTDRGTLIDSDEATIEQRLLAVIEQLRDRFPFETDLRDEQRVELVRGFYRGDTDAELAERLSVDEGTVVRARLELHLFREADTDAPVEWETLRRHLRETDDDGTVAAALDLETGSVRQYRRVLVAREHARRVSHRYRSALRGAIPDAALADTLTADVTEDGLEEAAADIETDVSF